MTLAIRSAVGRKVLEYFFTHESDKVYINQLAREINDDPKNVYRMLIRFEENGILSSDFAGRERYFSANHSNPLYRAYREITAQPLPHQPAAAPAQVQQKKSIQLQLKDALQKLETVREAHLYGEYLETEKSGSELGLLLIGTHDPLVAHKLVMQVREGSGIDVRIVTLNFTPEEFGRMASENNPFLRDILKGKTEKIK
jgi:Fe2+ or Zn2+ uptake regulation protein